MRKMSSEELIAILKDGGKIKREDQPMVIEGFKELVSQMAKVIEQQQEDSKKQREFFQKAVEQLVQAIDNKQKDISNMETLLTTQTPRPAYEFDIERDPRGYLKSITATPKTRMN